VSRRDGHRRNVAGLLRHAQQKHADAVRKVDTAIHALVRGGEPITFRRVASIAAVSTAWLYAQPDIKERIIRLRSQDAPRPTPAAAEHASEASKNAMLRALRQRVAELEQDRRSLLKKIQQLEERAEVLYGELYQDRLDRPRTDPDPVRREHARNVAEREARVPL
jgi:hypothetical protein